LETSEKNSTLENNSNNTSNFVVGEENEPYLGPSWALLMLLLYFLKQLFPAEKHTFYWYFQIYILSIVVGVTIFTLVKRHRFFNSDKDKKD
jgi:hypothetical protein